MSKAVKKKAPAKKAAPKKAAPKKMAQPAKVAKPAQKEAPQESFMWKLLKKKEAERKRLQEEKKSSKFNMHGQDELLPTGVQGYSRFNGPRRKAA